MTEVTAHYLTADRPMTYTELKAAYEAAVTDRDVAIANAEAWRIRYEDFRASIKRHVDGLVAALVRAEGQKEEKE